VSLSCSTFLLETFVATKLCVTGFIIAHSPLRFLTKLKSAKTKKS
jgi:hypothetical protein